MTGADLAKRFAAHPVGEIRAAQLDVVREFAQAFAITIDSIQPDSREKSLAITALEEVVFWANAGISRNGADGPLELMDEPALTPGSTAT